MRINKIENNSAFSAKIRIARPSNKENIHFSAFTTGLESVYVSRDAFINNLRRIGKSINTTDCRTVVPQKVLQVSNSNIKVPS